MQLVSISVKYDILRPISSYISEVIACMSTAVSILSFSCLYHYNFLFTKRILISYHKLVLYKKPPFFNCKKEAPQGGQFHEFTKEILNFHIIANYGISHVHEQDFVNSRTSIN